MKQSIWTSGSPSNPQAFITKRKQRIKQFEGQVYLNDGDEYERQIEIPGRFLAAPAAPQQVAANP